MFDVDRPRDVRAVGAAAVGRVDERRALTPAEIAWVALIPCALVALAAILVLGPPLGRLLFPHGPDALWPREWWETEGRAEPVKHGRYVLAVLAPLLFAAVVLAGVPRRPRLAPRTIALVTQASMVAVAAFAAVALLGQHNVIAAGRPLPPVFGTGMLLAAAALVAAAAIGLRAAGVRARLAALARETRWKRVACLALAGALAAVWLLQAVTTDRLVEDGGQMNWTLNDAFAVLNGRTPLVDFHVLYAQLIPYPAALALIAFGKTGFVYTLFMALLSLLALLAVYATFRRVVRSSPLALGLFVPFLALGDGGVEHVMRLPALWPMRYGGAYLVAWLTARHLDGARGGRDSHPWPLFLVAGLVAVNNLEFGSAALLASAAALPCALPPRSRRELLRLAGALAAGVAGAWALVSLLTLARTGALPSLDLLLEWPHIFTNLGWFSMPMPVASLHLAIYATFAAAIAVAAVRLARAADDRLLTGMLAWSGVFGLLAGSYFVGRSDDLKLASLFSAWGFALALLTVVCVRALSARDWRAPTVAELLVLLGFALAACTVAEVRPPQHEIERLRQRPELRWRPYVEPFLRESTRPGQRVAILLPESFRLAYDVGVRNVAPYGISNAIVTVSQMRTLLDVLRRERVTAVFVPEIPGKIVGEAEMAPDQFQLLLNAGFVIGPSLPNVTYLVRRSR